MTRSLQKIFWFYTILIPILAVLPLNGANGTLNNNYFISIRLDHVLHIGLFALWLVLYKLAYFTGKSFYRKSDTITFIALVTLFALSCEFIQALVPYRSFNINDLLANLIGVFIGLLFLFFIPVNIVKKLAGTQTKI
jgi:VanZ family protein